MGTGDRRRTHSVARPWVPISFPLTHMVYLAGSKSVSVHQSDPDTMTNTALEAIAESSGKKNTTERNGIYRPTSR